MVQEAIKSGADVNERDDRGTDALHYAEFARDFDMMRVLLDSGQIHKELIEQEVAYLKSLKKMLKKQGTSPNKMEEVVSLLKSYL